MLVLIFLTRTTNLGKYGSFNTNALLGQPYGLSYEIVNKELKVVCATPFEDVGA